MTSARAAEEANAVVAITRIMAAPIFIIGIGTPRSAFPHDQLRCRLGKGSNTHDPNRLHKPRQACNRQSIKPF
jgi:hypothetical protein